MKVLVTAGSTSVKIDKVRVIANIFKGRTGYTIANYFSSKGEDVTLITSNFSMIEYNYSDKKVRLNNIIPYKTFDNLEDSLRYEIVMGNYDVVIHSAAVSDYKVDGVFYRDDIITKMSNLLNSYRASLISGDTAEAERYFYLTCEAHDKLQITRGCSPFIEVNSDGKVPSKYKELFLKMSPTDKIIDKIREQWGFSGKLVKFKLQVDMSDEKLLEIAKKSRKQSQADLIVANCLEWCDNKAYIIGENSCNETSRRELPRNLYNELNK